MKIIQLKELFNMSNIFDRFRTTSVPLAEPPQQQSQGSGENNGAGGAGDTGENENDDSNPYGAVADIFSEPAEEDVEEEDETPPAPKLGPDGKPLKSEEQLIAERVQAMIQGIKVGEDAIPEDFDPTDPKKFREVLGKIQQQTALATMGAMMEPMKAAMKAMTADLKNEIQTSIQQFGGSSQSRQLLEQHVPESKNPELSGLVTSLFDNAKKKYPKDSLKAVMGVRKALDALGFKSSDSEGGNGSDPSSGGFRSGNSALDLFAPIPKR